MEVISMYRIFVTVEEIDEGKISKNIDAVEFICESYQIKVDVTDDNHFPKSDGIYIKPYGVKFFRTEIDKLKCDNGS